MCAKSLVRDKERKSCAVCGRRTGLERHGTMVLCRFCIARWKQLVGDV